MQTLRNKSLKTKSYRRAVATLQQPQIVFSFFTYTDTVYWVKLEMLAFFQFSYCYVYYQTFLKRLF